ncbi:uncharacterized protein LOC143151419 [Ptiloglossa arizonensis]|uniref:uncharacterized protein LOC143151419 n=1 Tax=Ptiloglossa arizonensis TaxID=3350558 RepID=UPI003F9F8C22
MDQFITTYQKDYTWPSTKIQHGQSIPRDGGPCACDTRSYERDLKVVELCEDEHNWSRIGPMGRLLDPKLYPAKTGPRPESEATKYDQPNTYIRKLEEKYPNLYGILQSTPMDEIIQRVDKDRLVTTYQKDYTDKSTVSTIREILDDFIKFNIKDLKFDRYRVYQFVDDCALYTSIHEIVGHDLRTIMDVPDAKLDTCDTVKQQIRKDSYDSTRSRLAKRAKQKRSLRKRKIEEDSQETRLPPWRSEYQDGIGKLGSTIMRHKIHRKKAPRPTWAMEVL